MAAWIVWNGFPNVPSAVASLPFGSTGTQTLQSSSTAPSQSSSTPSHAGPSMAVAGVPGTQATTPPLVHDETVLRHAPTPQLNWGRPSSFKVLQSSSWPLHASALGMTSPTQGP